MVVSENNVDIAWDNFIKNTISQKECINLSEEKQPNIPKCGDIYISTKTIS